MASIPGTPSNVARAREHANPNVRDDDWTLYAHHRAHLTDAVLSSAAAPGGRLCILGAGACNDIDLEQLSLVFSEIHLVDIDASALGRAVARQRPAVRSRLRPHARVDLSGMTKRLTEWKRRPPTPAQLDALGASTSQALIARLPGPFDVVVSACVLTQMSFAAMNVLGEGHRMLWPIRLSLLGTHLHALVGLTVAGGASLFVSDLTSSSLFPLKELDTSRSLHDVMNQIVASGACYHVAKPALVTSILESDGFRERVWDPDLLDPWLWWGRLDRTYFVYALRMRRRG